MPFVRTVTTFIFKVLGFRRRTFISQNGFPRIRYLAVLVFFVFSGLLSNLNLSFDRGDIVRTDRAVMDALAFLSQTTFPDIEKAEAASGQALYLSFSEHAGPENIASDIEGLKQTIALYFEESKPSDLKRFIGEVMGSYPKNFEKASVETKTKETVSKTTDNTLEDEKKIISAALVPEGRTEAESKISPKPVMDIENADQSDSNETAAAGTEGTILDKTETLTVRPGDTLEGILANAGIDSLKTHEIIKAVSKVYNPRSIKSGQTISFIPDMDDSKGGAGRYAALDMPLDKLRTLKVSWKNPGQIDAAVKTLRVDKELRAKKVEVRHSLYQTALDHGIPSDVISQAIHLYSWDIDFQRDIRRGDELELLYEIHVNERGEAVGAGDILYASIETFGQRLPVYRYGMSGGQIAYFEPDGNSLRKALMQTPVDGARISSGYGMRMHPILGYSKMHKGVDFAAPLNTPVYAAGDGIVERAGRYGAYGNYIRLRHRNGYKTAYGHLNKFASNIRAGSEVKQGDVIGYVGSTGRSTGPHLHYEVHVNGKHVNPRNLDLPKNIILTGSELEDFRSQMNRLNNEFASLIEGVKYAQITPEKLLVH